MCDISCVCYVRHALDTAAYVMVMFDALRLHIHTFRRVLYLAGKIVERIEARAKAKLITSSPDYRSDPAPTIYCIPADPLVLRQYARGEISGCCRMEHRAYYTHAARTHHSTLMMMHYTPPKNT